VGDLCPNSKRVTKRPLAFEHRELAIGTIKEMVEAGAFTRLPKCQRPTVVILIDVVRKPRSDKFRRVINMRYVNRHLAEKVFKFEGGSESADIAEKGVL